MNEFFTKTPPMCGDCVDNYAKSLCAESIESEEMRIALFNECPMIAFPGDTAERVYSRWRSLFDEKRAAYRISPKGVQEREASDRRQKESRAEAEAFIAEMENADLSSIQAAISLVKRSSCLGWVYTQDLAKRFVEILASAGYQPNVNCGDAFKEDDAENYGRYVIGQAMTMPGHGIEQTFCERWEQRFLCSP